uniref:Uncharacterized protein n=1 Tax=Octactis speculum TaxID=3111310 RepID=A0A7S2AQY0_9STRA
MSLSPALLVMFSATAETPSSSNSTPIFDPSSSAYFPEKLPDRSPTPTSESFPRPTFALSFELVWLTSAIPRARVITSTKVFMFMMVWEFVRSWSVEGC